MRIITPSDQIPIGAHETVSYPFTLDESQEIKLIISEPDKRFQDLALACWVDGIRFSSFLAIKSVQKLRPLTLTFRASNLEKIENTLMLEPGDYVFKIQNRSGGEMTFNFREERE